MNFKNTGLLFITAVLFTACKLFDRGVDIPAYLYVKPVKLSVNTDLTQGEASIDTNDVWVFENGKLIGTFATPANIPVIKKGATTITCLHGIKQNGQNEERMIYPMFKEYAKTVSLSPQKIDTINPVTTYADNVVFALIEDFERAGFNFEYNPQFKMPGDTIERLTGADAWKGNSSSGRVSFKNDSSILEIYSSVFNNFKKYTPTFLELDYKNTIPFIVGLYITEPGGDVRQIPVFYFNEKAKWNKIYINLENEIGAYPSNSSLRLFFRFSRSYNFNAVNPVIWLDNIKFVYLD